MEDLEKKDIQDAKIDEVVTVDGEKNKNYRTEIILIVVIGLLLGIMIKAEFLKKVSIGFSDYKVTGGAQEYDFKSIEEKLTKESENKEGATTNANSAQNGNANSN